VFTIEEIDELHRRFGQADTLPDYVHALAELGVVRYDSFVADGHSEYVGLDTRTVSSSPAHKTLSVVGTSDCDAFLGHLRRHERGETSYTDMSKGLAESGIERWTVDTHAMTMTFYDTAGTALLVEQIS
jgi:uncharacterized protein YbcV (DUF1398 family)